MRFRDLARKYLEGPGNEVAQLVAHFLGTSLSQNGGRKVGRKFLENSSSCLVLSNPSRPEET